MFSPWYRWSGRRDPENHVCLNVVTYGPGGRFTMTDRGRPALHRSATEFRVGPSRMVWDGSALVIEVDEWSSWPLVSRVQGRIVLTPAALADVELPLSPDGAHAWRPLAPVARVTVDLSQGHRWQGHGYFDSNHGTSALERDFRTWTWGRFPVGDGAVCFYDAERSDGTRLETAVRFDRDGRHTLVEPPPRATFGRSRWLVARETRADAGFQPRQVLAMLDAPFYTRAVVETQIGGELSRGVHEALDLRRFKGPWLMPMLATRVPRRAGWG
ncbi:MAG: carotenoid 1,2-hydratase [Gemmobacter sp.]|nr:carotenoid 1,2-hydratase [Gemmobacter sp.]